tara:strand:- start:910 stop:1131 length:222 start_codon:yes stop_codon:yes gene_type:complete
VTVVLSVTAIQGFADVVVTQMRRINMKKKTKMYAKGGAMASKKGTKMYARGGAMPKKKPTKMMARKGGTARRR